MRRLDVLQKIIPQTLKRDEFQKIMAFSGPTMYPIRLEFFGFFSSIRTEIFRPDGYTLIL